MHRTDPDEIDISSNDSDGLEGNDHIETIEEGNSQISFAAALQMLDQLQDFFLCRYRNAVSIGHCY